MTDEKREKLERYKKELNGVSEVMKDLAADLHIKAQIAEKAFQEFYKVKLRKEQLERLIISLEKPKPIPYGRSGIKKAKKGGGKLFDLNAYTNSLSPGKREEFIQALLNANL